MAFSPCLYFGCWNVPGHFLWLPGGRSAAYLSPDHYGKDLISLDGILAPRRLRDGTRSFEKFGGFGKIVWAGMGATRDERSLIRNDSEEFPQGKFLLHYFDSDYTAIQWWDRTQGDEREACNSTILLHGKHSANDMTAALVEHFPHVAENLTKRNVGLTEVVLP